ncbi:hypothetical protein B2I21_33050 [Chryseobacterium mucoviscidosis]|nr:hypothetical protein B2I21_33050 [Chryseobacterium mucoviscidosis]
MAKVFAPNKEYTGLSAGVAFANGVGETDTPHLLSWFKSKGYEVEKDPVDQPDDVPVLNLDPGDITGGKATDLPADPPEDKSAKSTKTGK